MLMDSIGRHFEDIWTSIYKFIYKSILDSYINVFAKVLKCVNVFSI